MKEKTAFLFAGQGAQFVGMGADFFTGMSGGVYDVMRDGPIEELSKTINAQPAIYLHGLAVAEELRCRGIVPDCVAGFSLGEVPALVFAGAMKQSEGLEFVGVRAEAMQRACEENVGAMLAVVRLPIAKVEEIVRGFEDVWVANYNSPEQVVCSCEIAQVDAFSAAVASAGGRALRLKVSGAFHSPLMADARLVVEDWLDSRDLRNLKIPCYSNWTGELYVHDYKERMAFQIQESVLWIDVIENMLADGVRTFVEVGPGNVLAGLVKKITEHNGTEGVKIFSAGDMAGVDAVVEEIGS